MSDELKPIECKCNACQAVNAMIKMKSLDGYEWSPIRHCVCELCTHLRKMMKNKGGMIPDQG